MNELVLNNLKFGGDAGEYCIGIDDGKIKCISKNSLKGDEVINFSNGEFLLPGLI